MVRDLFRNLLGNIRVRIAAGPNEGLKWSLTTSGRGYGNGTFEPVRIQTIASLIQPGECFWDIGAHKGYVTLLAARRVGANGKVYTFEPSPGNLWYLHKHLRWNNANNVQVIPVAVSNFEGIARFGGGSSLASRLGGGRDRVTVRSIRSLLDAGECEPPTFLKIDAEGAEADILTGAGAYLDRPDMALLVSVHSEELYRACTAILQEHGYRIIESGEIAACHARGWDRSSCPWLRGDPDLLAIGPERPVADEELEPFVTQGRGLVPIL